MKQIIKNLVKFVRDCCDCKLGKRKRRVTWRDQEGEELEFLIPLPADTQLETKTAEETQLEDYLRHLLHLNDKEESDPYKMHDNSFFPSLLEERCSVGTWLSFVIQKLELKPYILQTAMYFLDKVIEVGLFGGENSMVLALGCLSVSCKINNVMLETTTTLAFLIEDSDNKSKPTYTVAQAEMVVLGILDFHLHPPGEEEFVYLLTRFIPQPERIEMHKLALATELVLLSGLRYSVCFQMGRRASGIETALAILTLAGVDQLHFPPEVFKLVKDWNTIERIQQGLSQEFLKYQMGKYSALCRNWFGSGETQQQTETNQETS